MARTYWKTTSVSRRRERIMWPSAVQLLGQLGIAALIVVLWSGMLVGYLRWVGRQTVASSTPPPSQIAAAANSDAVPTPTPTITPTSEPTSTPSPTAEQPAVTVAPELKTVTPLLVESSPTSSVTPTSLPTPTETAVPPPDTPVPADESAEVSFARDVFPIFERRCAKCHGGPQDDGTLRIEEGLKLTSYDDAIAGSWNGPVIEPGSSEDSFLVEQIVTGEMPKKEPRLLPAEIRVISAWIDAGALDN